MSDIPVISITQECSDDDMDDISKLNINDAHTDTEDLIMDQDTVRFRKVSKTGNTMVDAIAPTTNGSVTDVEDCTDSEDEGEVKSAREADITLDSFLDQGFVDEMSNSANKGDKPKTLSRCFSKTTESDSLQVFTDINNALTDCEDCDMSGDDDSLGRVSIPDCPEDILMKGNDNDSVDIHNVVKRKQEKHFHKHEVVEGSSSESDNDTKVRHRKSHRKQSDDRPKSDCENLSMSDEELAGACARPPNRRSALFEAEELVMEGSDVEEDMSHNFPEINITFVTDENVAPPARKKPSTLSVQAPNPDEAVTDVENLDSSDSEDEKDTRVKSLMPRAVVRNSRSGGGGTTDVEDFNDSDENEYQEQKREVGQEFLPSPVREMSIVKHDKTGEQRQNVMPMNQGLLLVRTPDIEQALTDVEDMSDNEEIGEMYDSSKYASEMLPEMGNDNVYSSDNTCMNSTKLEVTSAAREPVTDTEDLFFERSASTGGTGSELRRRRKPKQSHAHFAASGASCHQFKGRKHLEMKADTAAATTDVEDLYLSDDGNDCGFERTTKQRRATIQFSGLTAATNDGDGKTDVEYLSGDEMVNERQVHSPQFIFEGFSSVTKERDQNGPVYGGVMEVHPIPMIRKISPSPDAHNCHTDCEDIQVGSDGDDQDQGLDGGYSRAQTATPFELTRALAESGSSEVHEINTHPRNELLDIKGMVVGDQQEIHTDVEFLDDDAANGADQ